MPTATATRPRPGVMLVTVAGDLDLAALGALEAALSGAHGCAQVIIDAAAVTFVDCAAMRPLLAAAREVAAGGGHLVVRDAAPPLARLITWCALEENLPAEQRARCA